MKSDYFDSPDFQELLSEYEYAKKLSLNKYFDEDDIADLSDYYVEQGFTTKALEVLELGLRLHPASGNLQIMLAGARLCSNMYDEAESLILGLNEECPPNNDYYYVCAQLQCAKYKEWDKAHTLFSKWIDLENDAIDADSHLEEPEEIKRDNYLHVLSSIREFAPSEQRAEALTTWVTAYLDRYESMEFGCSEIDIAVAELCREETLLDVCERAYTLLLETKPYHEGGWSTLASVQVATCKFNEALESADFALAIDPQDCNSMYVKGNALVAQGRYDEALTVYHKCVKTLDELEKEEDYKREMLADAYLYIGMCYAKLERWKEAEPYLQSSIEWNRKSFATSHANMWNCRQLADTLYCLGRYEEALEQIEMAVAMAPDDRDFKEIKGDILLVLRDFEAAIRCFYSEDYCVSKHCEALMWMGLRLTITMQPNAAIDLFRYVLDVEADDPDSKISFAYLVFCYYQIGDVQSSLSYLQDACAYSPNALEDLFGNATPPLVGDKYYDYLYKIITSNSSK